VGINNNNTTTSKREKEENTRKSNFFTKFLPFLSCLSFDMYNYWREQQQRKSHFQPTPTQTNPPKPPTQKCPTSRPVLARTVRTAGSSPPVAAPSPILKWAKV
jgi:hypothetical protein